MEQKIKLRVEELEKQLAQQKFHAECLSWRHNFQEKEIAYSKCDRLESAIKELKALL